MGYTAIIDYGVGNLKSVSNALAYLGVDSEITGDPCRLELADAIILPGVGAVPDAADKLRESGLEQILLRQAGNKPILGICLGMQLLFQWGEEGRRCEGLGLISGGVRRIETDLKLPHIGWNSLTFPGPSPLFRGLDEGCCVYFVHSFYAAGCGDSLAATTEYGLELTAAVERGNVCGCQFHPEKSGAVGLDILRAFCAMEG